MKTTVTRTTLFVALISSAWTFRALAQNADPAESGPPMMMDRQTWMDRMKDMGMSDAMMSRCRMMRTLEVSAYDPAGILALKEELQLSEQQVQKLQTLLQASRDGAKAALTDSQKQKLRVINDTPNSMMQMHQHMMDRMQKMMKGKGWTHRRMMCPMHMMMGPMMMDMPADGNATQPAQNTDPAQSPRWGCCDW